MADQEFGLYDHARRHGFTTHERNGLPRFNRRVMSHADMVRMSRSKGDLFVVFKDDLGATFVEYSRIEDFAPVIVREVIGTRLGDDPPTESMVKRIAGLLMISRSHGFDFDNFVFFLDHDLTQIYDSMGLAIWVGMNTELFASRVDFAVQIDAEDREALEAEDRALRNAA